MWSNKEADFFPEIKERFTFPGMGQMFYLNTIHSCVLNSMVHIKSKTNYLMKLSATLTLKIRKYNTFCTMKSLNYNYT